MQYNPTIGIETHVELKTNSKMFCRCKVVDTEEPNVSLCPTCLGLPGALPVPNKKAIEFITLLALSTNCKITKQGMFHRKNYFYPDLPKNYQISQFDLPVGINGSLKIVLNDQEAEVAIERVHMEEDTGKSTHMGTGRIDSATSTALDFNRSGVPLVEIVTKPVLKTSLEAVAYIEELRQLVLDLGISEGKLEKGNLRFDANISVANSESDVLGTKVEIKNMNSLRSLERAIDYEIERQIKALNNGEIIAQETRHWDEGKEVTKPMRSKEGSADYRYFSDPDIPNMVLDEEFVNIIKSKMPKLPYQKRLELMQTGLSIGEANILSKSNDWIVKLFQDVYSTTKNSSSTYNWITGELQGQMRKVEINELPSWFKADSLSEIINLIESNKISFSSGKVILAALLVKNVTPYDVAKEQNLFQENDSEKILQIVKNVITENSEVVVRIKNGEDKLIGFLVGLIIKSSGGSINPSIAKDLLSKELEE
ncbi:MAG: Asp-tRNA(Asn)/Glu-tRNA(Gln) amidotransferase subunit GatB [Candidatus Actinomarina sp.]